MGFIGLSNQPTFASEEIDFNRVRIAPLGNVVQVYNRNPEGTFPRYTQGPIGTMSFAINNDGETLFAAFGHGSIYEDGGGFHPNSRLDLINVRNSFPASTSGFRLTREFGDRGSRIATITSTSHNGSFGRMHQTPENLEFMPIVGSIDDLSVGDTVRKYTDAFSDEVRGYDAKITHILRNDYIGGGYADAFAFRIIDEDWPVPHNSPASGNSGTPLKVNINGIQNVAGVLHSSSHFIDPSTREKVYIGRAILPHTMVSNLLDTIER